MNVTKGKFSFVKPCVASAESKKLLMPQNGSTSNGTTICQGANKKQTYQQWNITPVDSRIGGDYSYFYVANAKNGAQLDILNWSTSNGGSIILYNGGKGSNEQWYFQYAGDGYYYILSRHSGKCLEVSGGSTSDGATILQNAPTGDDKQLWRLMPINATCEQYEPEAPMGLTATSNAATIDLTWNTVNENDVTGYLVLRADATNGAPYAWNTIARNVSDTTFIDNTVRAGNQYIYKVKAIDRAQNRSAASDSVVSSTLDERALIAHYIFEESLEDLTGNHMHGAFLDSPTFLTAKKGELRDKALTLDGSSDYMQLPTALATHKEMTIAMWVRWKGNGSNQRIFDFGNGDSQYMYLTANAASNKMRFGMKNNGEEQYIDISKLSTYQWKHVTITISNDSITAYIDGEQKAATADITIRPADFNPIFNYIGRSQFASDPMLKADIDDVRFYNYALSASEVEDIYLGNDTKVDHNTATRATITSVCYYTLDGTMHSAPQQGINVVRTTYSDGSIALEKIISK